MALCDLSSSFASSKDRRLLVFLSSKSQTHTCSSIKCFPLVRKAVGISNFWNLHVVLPCVWAQTEPPQVEVSPELLLLLTDGLAAWTGIIFFFFSFLGYFQQVIFWSSSPHSSTASFVRWWNSWSGSGRAWSCPFQSQPRLELDWHHYKPTATEKSDNNVSVVWVLWFGVFSFSVLPSTLFQKATWVLWMKYLR